MRNCLILFFLAVSFDYAAAQISHGGRPKFAPAGMLRAAEAPVFVMPPFDGDSAAKAEEALSAGVLRGYCFARDFAVDIVKSRDFGLTVMPDGTRVWRATIRSAGAFSINLLFDGFRVPEGGRLFVYNADGSHVAGSFDSRNCKAGGRLPIRPVAGDEVTVEYSEPSDAEFEGDFTIVQVNHDFRDILNREPATDIAQYACMTDALCSGATEAMVRSSVMLIINGSVACSGVLLNNTADDGAPLILTAVHCLNDELEMGVSKTEDFYITRAGTVVAFFNYVRPLCSEPMRGIEEMSLAEAVPRMIAERKDVALIEMRERPPVWFNAFYSGWNAEQGTPAGPYSNVHHPSGATAKYGFSQNALTVVNFMPDIFDASSHRSLAGWTEGSTHAGSSGSPLFDGAGSVIGALSGGESTCNGFSPNGRTDYFSNLAASWEIAGQQVGLKQWLDPVGKNLRRHQGLDPNVAQPLLNLGNADFANGDSLTISLLSGGMPLFGRNDSNAGEFAEAFATDSALEVFGAYLYVPRQNISTVPDVDIALYEGDDIPRQLIVQQHFNPTFVDFRTDTKIFEQRPRNLTASAFCSFVRFDEPVIVQDRFFVSCKINNNATPNFCLYNTKFADPTHLNSAWIKTADGRWEEAAAEMPTSLAIRLLARRISADSVQSPENASPGAIYNRQTRLLTVSGADFHPLTATVYSLSGQIIQKIGFPAGYASITLAEKPSGTTGIVRISGEKNNISLKIIY
jgi:hypothetical protein